MNSFDTTFACGHFGEIDFACTADEMDADRDQVVAALTMVECPHCSGDAAPDQPNIYLVHGVPGEDIILAGSDHEA